MKTKNILLSLVTAMALLACGGSDKDHAQRAPVVIVGIDGAEWSVIEALLEEGELPNFRRFLDEGAWGGLINTGPETSPLVWTTFVTGHFAREHGILDHVYPYDDSSGKRPVTSDLRLKPTLWNIADAHGLKSVVVGYFVSHPPEEIEGVMISPMAAYWQDSAIWPEGAIDIDAPPYAELRDEEVVIAMARRYFDWPWEPGQADDPDSPYQREAQIVRKRHLDRRIVRDEFMRRAGREIAAAMADDPADLFINYFRLPDFMSHSLWMFHEPEIFEAEPDAEMLDRFDGAINESYRYMDEILEDILDEWNGAANIIVLSDHGFDRNSGEFEADTLELTGNHRPVGILLALGPDIRPGRVAGMTDLEVMPTLAALLGVAVSDEWHGRVETGFIEDGFFEAHPLKAVRRYELGEARRREDRVAAEAVQDDMSSLRGLGYVGEGVSSDPSAVAGTFDFWTAEHRLVERSLVGEIVFALLNDAGVVAQQTLEELAARRPEQVERLVRAVQAKVDRIIAQTEPGDIELHAYQKFVETNTPAHN